MKSETKNSHQLERSVNLILSCVTCFMFFLYSPLELLFTNQNEFWFDFRLLFLAMFPVFLVCFFISMGILRIFLTKNMKLYHFVITFYFIAFVCSYMQGNFLAGNLPPLDGTYIDWSLYPGERVKTICLWAIVTLVITLLIKRMKMDKFLYLIKYVSAFMFAMLLLALLSVGIMEHGFKTKPNMTVSVKNMFEMSEDTNFIILLLDAVDGQGWNESIEEHPEYVDILEDFTYYDDAVGAYSFTKHSIPFILSGKWHENEIAYADYSTDAYLHSPLFEKLQKESYKIGIYERDMILNDERLYLFDNILPNERGVTSWTAFIRWHIQMTGFKYAPFDLKRICFVNPNAFEDLRIPPKDYGTFSADNQVFYHNVLEEDVTLTSEKCFKFIHIDGAHLPFRYDENVNIIPETEGTYAKNMEACMTITKAYLEKLKENNVYDNSVIVVMSDHGFRYDDMEDTLHRQNPVLFVKGISEKHDYQVSKAPVSWADLQDIFNRLLEGEDSLSVSDYQEGDERERRYLYYEYNEDAHMYEYIQKGTARDKETFRPTGREYILK